MDDEEEGIPWPALVLDPARLEPFVKVRSPWLPWREDTQLGMISPEEAARQFEAWADWLERLLGDPFGVQASTGFRMGIALLRKDAPTPVVMMNAIAGFLVAIEQEIQGLRGQQSSPNG